MSSPKKHKPAPSDIASDLVRNHRAFLKFVGARTRDAHLAEEILQTAYAKSMGTVGTLRDDESATAWFYRLLRNAIADHYRRLAREERGRERHARGDMATIDADALHAAVCECVGHLAATLKREHAVALRRIDIEDATVPELAAELGITPNNAGVRLHRARQALRGRVQMLCGACAKHGCLDCTCSSNPQPGKVSAATVSKRRPSIESVSKKSSAPP